MSYGVIFYDVFSVFYDKNTCNYTNFSRGNSQKHQQKYIVINGKSREFLSNDENCYSQLF